MEEEGVELLMGSEGLLEFKDVDSVYISPTVPQNSPIRHMISGKSD